jgi:hypothetical protein
MAKQYDRSAEDLGNVVGLEHVNVLVPDQGWRPCSTSAAGADPRPLPDDQRRQHVGQCRQSQFHLPTGKAQVLRGRTAMVIPGRDLLVKRLENMKKPLEGTKFSFKEHDDHVTAICPWGNEYVLYEPSKRFAGMVLGMPYVEFDVPQKTAKGIAAFYSEVFGTMASVKDHAAHVSVGYGQELIFRETDKPLAPYDGHHLQVYVANFSEPHRRLVKRKILTEESNQYQYRFNDIVDPRPARSCSSSSTRSGASPIRSMPGRWSTATRARATATTCRAATAGCRSGRTPTWATRAAPCARPATRK